MISIEELFTYHPPQGNQVERYQEIRDKGRELAELIKKHCPNNSDTQAAIEKIREAVMRANAAIACGEIYDENEVIHRSY